MISRHAAFRFLLTALGPEPAADCFDRDSLSVVDWQGVLSVANEHMLAPALFATLSHQGLLRQIPPEVRRYLMLLYRMNGRRNRAVGRQIFELAEALNRRGIEPLLLKGAVALATDGPIDPATRMMADIDFAVRPVDSAATIDTLQSLGYALRSRYPEGHHAYGEFTRAGSPAAVDLHFELIDQPYLLSIDEMWLQAHRLSAAGSAVFHIPSATDRLFHHLLHAQIHHLGAYYRGTLDLRQLHEFALLAREGSGAVDWAFIWHRMRRYHLLTPLYSYLMAAGRMFGTTWPLPAPPTLRARAHVARCELALRAPAASRWTLPWGNLRSAFAWHRMSRLYGGRRVPAALWRAQHIGHVLRKHPLDFPLNRLFRL